MDLQKEIDFFDQFEGEYDVLGEGAYRRLLALFGELVRPRGGERCIDLGCGTGAFTKRLRSFGLELTGLDISPVNVQKANASAGPGERYVVGDMLATGLPDGAFDIVVYSGVLHHVDDVESRVRVLAEGHRLLRPGGRVFAYDPSAQSPSMWLYRDPRSPLFSSKGKTDNEVLLRKDELREQLARAGFVEARVRGVSGITFRFVDSAIARKVLFAYNVYEQLVRYSPFEDRLGTFLVSFATKR
jgi:SAM-dependent methyltransferase